MLFNGRCENDFWEDAKRVARAYLDLRGREREVREINRYVAELRGKASGEGILCACGEEAIGVTVTRRPWCEKHEVVQSQDALSNGDFSVLAEAAAAWVGCSIDAIGAASGSKAYEQLGEARDAFKTVAEKLLVKQAPGLKCKYCAKEQADDRDAYCQGHGQQPTRDMESQVMGNHMRDLCDIVKSANRAETNLKSLVEQLSQKCKHPFIAEEYNKTSYGGYRPPWRMCLVCRLREQRDHCGKPGNLWGKRHVQYVDNAFKRVQSEVVITSLQQLASGVTPTKTDFIKYMTEERF
jgi:hypothetical protein